MFLQISRRMPFVLPPWRFLVSIIVLLSLAFALCGGAAYSGEPEQAGAPAQLMVLDDGTSPADTGDDLAQLSPLAPTLARLQQVVIPEKPAVFTSRPSLPLLRPPKIA